MNKTKRNKGRPKKIIKRNKALGVKCTFLEEAEIKMKAKQYNKTVSEYLRELGLKHKVIIKTLPPEVIAFQIKLNQACASLNQIARKRNMNDQLSSFDRAKLNDLSEQLHEISITIRYYINDC